MKNYFILFMCLFILSCSTKEPDSESADLSLRIDLNTIYDSPGQGALVLYPISEMEDSLYSKITFPDLSKMKDTTFAQIFFTGKNHSAIENSILLLMGDHASESPFIWVDYDNDLDFSEVKEPLRFSENFIEVSIPDMEKPRLTHTIRFHKPDSKRKAEIKESLELYVLKGEKYTDFFLDERRNIRVGDFVYKQDSFRIGLMDWNINGSYSDWGTDRVVIGAYGGDISGTDEASGAVVLDSITYFQGGSYAFEIMEVPDNGTSVLIKPALADKIEDRITKGETIPDYAFQLFSGKKTSVYNYLDGHKYLYLSFWASWCSGCRQEVEDLKKIHSGYPDKFTIVSLNYNEDAEKIKSFLDKYDIQWLNGYSTTEINEELFIQGLPRNILVDPSGRISEMNIRPSELLERADQF
ncbi:MAG: TlpA family protein disulfide reductase [Bacteroidota bacterium]